MFRAADLDDARTVVLSSQVLRLARAFVRAHGCGSVPDFDRLPLIAELASSDHTRCVAVNNTQRHLKHTIRCGPHRKGKENSAGQVRLAP
jgi:hypothetical protein